MNIKKLTSLILTLIIILQLIPTAVIALGNPVGTVTGESGRFYEEITLSDGTKTGVRYTEMALSGYYGTNKTLRLAECDLSNTNLSIDVINCGTYTVSRTTMATAANKHSKDGKTVLAAINGDLWMTAVNSNSNVTKKTLCTTRGVMMIDGEIWATQEFGMENYANTSNAGTTASQKAAFGITDKNQPVVGSPHITITVNNESAGINLTADGLNRLPAWDSLVVYNHRINSSNYALNDSYEVELSTNDATFTVDGKVTAKVVAIYPEGSATRPAIGENTIVLTARGSRIADLKGAFYIGDTVTFDASLVDKYGNTDLWHSVVDAIGGHMEAFVDDEQTMVNESTSEYPTSLIGIKDDGTVMFCGVHTSKAGVYKGLKFKDVFKLCRELDYNSVFYLDGGGSASFVTLKDGTYTQRNLTSDSGGAARAVINGVAIVWNDTPVCDEQGSLAYIETQGELSSVSPEFLPAGVLERIAFSANNMVHTYKAEDKTFSLSINKDTSDPYVNLSLAGFSKTVKGDDYPYILIKLKEPMGYSSNIAIYYFAGGSHYAKTVTVAANQTFVTVPMYSTAGWSGEISHIRIDMFEGQSVSRDLSMDIEYLAFTADPDIMFEYEQGKYPDGTITDYYAYKECAGDHTFALTNVSGTHHKSVCSNCSIKYTEEHSYSEDYTVIVEPTPTSAGVKARKCACGALTDVTAIPKTAVLGDATGDGVVNGKDSNQLKKFIAGATVPTEAEMAASDVNADGTLNGMDANVLSQFLAGAIGGF